MNRPKTNDPCPQTNTCSYGGALCYCDGSKWTCSGGKDGGGTAVGVQTHSLGPARSNHG
jgi:hypothetical protein